MTGLGSSPGLLVSPPALGKALEAVSAPGVEAVCDPSPDRVK